MMAMRGIRWYVLLASMVAMLTIGLRLDARQERDAGGFKAPTAALERGRAVYVLNHCHFCHGVDLTRATMGAANLSQSPLVGADEDGNMIGPLVKAGLPNLQTAMPSYVELTSAEIVELARYIHFLRQQAQFKELSHLGDAPAGNPTAGEAYFNGAANCRSCHSVTGNLAGIGRKYDAAKLRERLLRPGPPMPSEGVDPPTGQAAHLRLLETYTPANVQDLVAYLSAAPQPVDFSGRWATEAEPGRALPTPAGAQPIAPGDMGSGWGSTITITQQTQLVVEYTFFGRGDMQPPLKFVYALDGSETRNTVMMGRGIEVQVSRAVWDGPALVITTTHTLTDPVSGKPLTVDVKRRLTLESPTSLVVEVTRDGVLGGKPSTTRTIYRKI